MSIDWDAPIAMDDGTVLRADVFRPITETQCPAILAYGGYGKNLRWQEGYPAAWAEVQEKYPEIMGGSSNNYQSWEYVDPEKWVPDDYAVVRVDARGTGRSPGVIENMSPREAQDLYTCIEWAGTQPWSTGKVGLSGISYLAILQWAVAPLQPPHLAAICVWEGAVDQYRDASHHGGILCTFARPWFEGQVRRVQYGWGSRGPRNPYTGILVTGDDDLSDEQLAANRINIGDERAVRGLDDDYYHARLPRLDKIVTPLLSAGNWGGAGLHLRGNIEGFLDAGSHLKWLEVHGGNHWAHFYDRYGLGLQKRFFAHFLKGEGDWLEQPRVLLQVRHPGERFVQRSENEWPLARTRWTPLYLQPAAATLDWRSPTEDQKATYQGLGAGLTLLTQPFEQETEVTGPIACKLWASSSTSDADLFLALRLFEPTGDEVLFQAAVDPRAPLTFGWLRASHRKLDPVRSTRQRPYHPHDEVQPLQPDRVYELDIEIWPTCIVIPAGYRLGLSVLGRDFDHGLTAATMGSTGLGMRGAGPFLHNDPVDRPAEIFDNQVSIYSGPERQSHLLIPIIPREEVGPAERQRSPNSD
jgi:predicted acyl esterase